MRLHCSSNFKPFSQCRVYCIIRCFSFVLTVSSEGAATTNSITAEESSLSPSSVRNLSREISEESETRLATTRASREKACNQSLNHMPITRKKCKASVKADTMYGTQTRYIAS